MQDEKSATQQKISAGNPTPPYNNGGQSDSLSTNEMFSGDITWCLDWVSFVGSESSLDDLRALMGKYFKYTDSDYAEAQKRGGLFGYLDGVWLAGCQLLEGHHSEKSYWNLQVQGEACRRLSENLIPFIRDVLLLLGVKVTRLDVAIDNKSPGAGSFLNAVHSACENKCLCLLKSWSVVTGSSGGKTVYLGSRSSSRFVRVYDKGIETGSLPAGQWVRYEAVFRAEVANKMLCDLIGSQRPVHEIMKVCRDAAVSVVDFKDKEDIHGHLERAENLPFWSAFLARLRASFVRYSVDREPSSYSSFQEWLKISVASPLESVIRKAGVKDWTPGQLLDLLTGSVMPSAAFHQENLRSSLCYAAKILREYVEGSEVPF